MGFNYEELDLIREALDDRLEKLRRLSFEEYDPEVEAELVKIEELLEKFN